MSKPDTTKHIGLALCLLGAFWLGALCAGAALDQAPATNTESWLYRWQTLIGAVVALIAAGIGAWFIKRQIETTERLENEKRIMRQRSIRAVLPLSLSELCDYAMRCSEKLTFLHRACGDQLLDRHADIDRTFPALPAGLATVFKEFIECSPENEARPLIEILSKLQVQSARFREIELNPENAPLVLKDNIEDYIIENAELYARAEAVFDYARFRSDRCDLADVSGAALRALWFFRFNDDLRYANLMRMAERRYDTAAPNLAAWAEHQR